MANHAVPHDPETILEPMQLTQNLLWRLRAVLTSSSAGESLVLDVFENDSIVLSRRGHPIVSSS